MVDRNKSKLNRLAIPLSILILMIGYCIVIFPKIAKTEQGITNSNTNSDIKGNTVVTNDAKLVKAIFKGANLEKRITDITNYRLLTNQIEEDDHINVYMFLLKSNLDDNGRPRTKGEYLLVLWNTKEEKVVGTVLESDDINGRDFESTKWEVSVLENNAKHSLLPKHSFLLTRDISKSSSYPGAEYVDKSVYGIVNDSLKRLVYLPKQATYKSENKEKEYAKRTELTRTWSYEDAQDKQYANVKLKTKITVKGSSVIPSKSYLASDNTYSYLTSEVAENNNREIALKDMASKEWEPYEVDVFQTFVYQSNNYKEIEKKLDEVMVEKILAYQELNVLDKVLKTLSLTKEQIDLSLSVYIQEFKRENSLLVLPIQRSSSKESNGTKYYDIHYVYIDQKKGTVLEHIIVKDAFPLKERSRFSLVKFGLVYNPDMPRNNDQVHLKARYTFYANSEIGPLDMIVYEDVLTINQNNSIVSNVSHLIVAKEEYVKVSDNLYNATVR